MLELKAGSSVPCCRFLLSLHGKTLEVLSVPPSVCLSQEGRHVHHLHPAKYWASMSFEPGGHLIVSPDAQVLCQCRMALAGRGWKQDCSLMFRSPA